MSVFTSGYEAEWWWNCLSDYEFKSAFPNPLLSYRFAQHPQLIQSVFQTALPCTFPTRSKDRLNHSIASSLAERTQLTFNNFLICFHDISFYTILLVLSMFILWVVRLCDLVSRYQPLGENYSVFNPDHGKVCSSKMFVTIYKSTQHIHRSEYPKSRIIIIVCLFIFISVIIYN